jgi:hypothetical protein
VIEWLKKDHDSGLALISISVRVLIASNMRMAKHLRTAIFFTALNSMRVDDSA